MTQHDALLARLTEIIQSDGTNGMRVVRIETLQDCRTLIREQAAQLEAEKREYIKLHEEFEAEHAAKLALSDDVTRHLNTATELGEKLIAALNWQPTAEHWLEKAHEFQTLFLAERKAREEAEDICKTIADWNTSEKEYRIRTYIPSKDELDERTRKCLVACSLLSDDQLQFAFEARNKGLFKLKADMEALQQRATAAEQHLAAVFAEMRERAAKVCDTQINGHTSTPARLALQYAAAAAIRALQPEGEESAAAQIVALPAVSPEPAASVVESDAPASAAAPAGYEHVPMGPVGAGYIGDSWRAAALMPGLELAAEFCRGRIVIYENATKIPFAIEHLHEAQIILELCTAEIERLKS